MKKFIALVLALAALVGTLTIETFADNSKENKNGIENSATSNDVDSNRAWVTLGNTIEGQHITFFDGVGEDKKSTIYNEKVVIDGVEARKSYSGNHVYFRLDEKFYNKENDHDFFINLTFYQFGPERGQFTFQYASQTGLKSMTIIKEKDPMWVTKQIYIGDAYFNHSIDELGADIKIVNGAYNAFAKLEVINANSIRYDNEFDVGTVSAEHAKTLYQLGLYSSSKNDAESDLANMLTKASAAAKLVKIIGRQKEAVQYTTKMSGATDEEKHAIGYLQNKKYVDWTGDAQAPITQKELVEVFAKVQGVSAQGDIIQNALDKGLLLKADMFLQPDKTAIEDNLVALGYNWLLMTSINGKQNIVNMMNDNLIDGEKLKESSEVKIQGLYYTTPRVIEKTEVIDSTTGRKYYYIDRGNHQLIREYYTANLWTADNKRFIVQDADESAPKYIYDIEKGTLQYLDYCYNPIVSKGTDKMYYFKGREVKKMDLNTFEIEKVADVYPEFGGSWGSSLTDDEKYLGVNVTEYSDPLDLRTPFGGYRQRKAPILNLETGEWNTTFHKEFMADEQSGMELNHVILNPKYDNLVFFAHEGVTETTPDRIWLLNTDTNEAFNLFRQKQRSETHTGETAGHEMWFGDGERLGFVKYPKSGNIGYSGIMTIDLTGKHKEYINNEYQYWHCCASPANDRFIVADTNNIVNGTVEIVLIDRYTGEAHLLCKPKLGYTSHPGHPQPAFSQDGRMVHFVVKGDNGYISTAWMDVSDIVDKPADGSRMEISDVCEVPSYKGTVNYIEESNKEGVDCFKVPAGKKMLVNVKDDKYQGDRVDVKISFSYYDRGFTPIKLSYFGWNEKSSLLDKTEPMKYEIARKNSKKWKTVTIELKDINLDNMEFIGTDFRLEGVYSELYVKDVEVEVTNVISQFMDQLPWTKFYKSEEPEA